MCGRAFQTGAALIEFLLVFPLLLLLFFGTIDFGRAYNAYLCLTDAALAGAEYGAYTGQSTNYSGMQTSATNDSSGLSGFTVTASRYCSCSPGGAAVSCATICASYGTPVAYVMVKTSATVPILFRYAILNGSYSLQSTAILRVQ
jgi:hypothetical protein